MNIQMGFWQWQSISHGIIGPLSRDKLHLSEIFAVLGLSILLWIAAGREIITLDSGFLRVRREIFGIGWSRQYLLAEVGDIRTDCFLDQKQVDNGMQTMPGLHLVLAVREKSAVSVKN